MEAFFAGLIGFLIGKGLAPTDAHAIVKALQQYLGFEPPVGLTGFVLKDMSGDAKAKSAVVVRGKTYNAQALEDLTKYDEVSVLAKSGNYLQVARTITHLKDVGTVDLLKEITEVGTVGTVGTVGKVDEVALLKTLQTLQTLNTLKTIEKINPDATHNVVINLIDEITKIGEISNIRDIIFTPSTFMVNAGFVQHFTGWGQKSGTVEIDTTKGKYTDNCLKFTALKVGRIKQFFPIPFGSNWLTAFYFWLRSPGVGATMVQMIYWYTDDTFTAETFGISTADTWERKTMNPIAGKYVEMLDVYHLSPYPECYVDDFIMVF